MALGCLNGFLPGSEPGTFPSVPPPPRPRLLDSKGLVLSLLWSVYF